jgi:hypothetical protein
MKELSKYRGAWSKVLAERTLHIFGLGFEERCLSYPAELSKADLHGGRHVFRCVKLSDDTVNTSLRHRRKKNETDIKDFLPSARITSIEEIEDEIDDSYDNFCLDISTLPRMLIFRLLHQVILRSRRNARIFIIYSYPEKYSSGALGHPASEISLCFKEPKLTAGEKVEAIILAGFDRPFTDISLTHIKAATEKAPEIQWQIPFPGRKYTFYERALESHLDLVKDHFFIYPQDEINLAYEFFKKKIESVNNMPIFFVPLGPRISCVPVFLATLWAKRKNIEANILIPRTGRYTSTRSENYQPPMIEEIRSAVLDVIGS